MWGLHIDGQRTDLSSAQLHNIKEKILGGGGWKEAGRDKWIQKGAIMSYTFG